MYSWMTRVKRAIEYMYSEAFHDLVRKVRSYARIPEFGEVHGRLWLGHEKGDQQNP